MMEAALIEALIHVCEFAEEMRLLHLLTIVGLTSEEINSSQLQGM